MVWFCATVGIGIAIIGSFVEGLFCEKATDENDFEMTEEEEAAYHFEFFHRR